MPPRLKITLRPLLSLLLALSLIPPTLAQQAAGKKIYTVAYAQDNLANDWRATQVKQFAEFFKPYPHIHFIYTDGMGKTAKQISDIEDLLHANVDVLVTSPRDSMAMTPVISKVYKQGIPVVLVTRTIQSNDYTSFIAPDDEEIARNAARYVARKLDNQGSVLILKGVPTATTAIARTKGFLAELQNYPRIKVTAILNGNYLRSDAIKVMHEAIANDIKFDAIYCQSDSMAVGARLALKKYGIDPANKVIVGIDYIKEARDAITRAEQSASFVYPTSVKETGEIILQILKGKTVPKRVHVPSQLVTIDNVNNIKPVF